MHNTARRAVASTTLVFLLLGNLVALAASNSSKAADAIKTADQQWAAAAAVKDLDKSVSFCGPDAAILVPDAPAAEGPEAIRKWFHDVFSIPGFKLLWHATESAAAKSGDLGYSRGTYELSYTDPSGKQISDHGKYITVWKKQPDGSWKVLRDIFNSDVSKTQ